MAQAKIFVHPSMIVVRKVQGDCELGIWDRENTTIKDVERWAALSKHTLVNMKDGVVIADPPKVPVAA